MVTVIVYNDDYWHDVDQALECVPNLTNLYGKKIFITGGTGMICSTVTELLLRLNQCPDAQIKIILGGRNLDRTCKRFQGFQEGKDFYFTYFDATKDQKYDIEADYMICGAGNANPQKYVDEPVETILANILGLNSLLASATQLGTKRILYISSSEVYGEKVKEGTYKEEDYGFVDILNTRAGYPCAKRAAESLCVAYIQEHGLDVVIVRPGHVYGPSITNSDDRASAQFTRNAVRGENIILKSAGLQLRSYCYTMDCASAILTVLLNGEKGQAYNISNRNSVVTIRDLAQTMARNVGKQLIYEDNSKLKNRGYNLMTNSALNAEKLEKLGWRARYDIDEGVKRTISLYVDENT